MANDLSCRLRYVLAFSFILLHFSLSVAQIQIGGSIYGGGNKGATGGNTTVTVYQGDLDKVFGGARMADVGGRAFVHIDGKHASNYILINYLYGGNDISGTIGTGTIPRELREAATNNIDNSWNAFMRISTKTVTTTTGTGEDAVTTVKEADDAEKIYIGQLFGGGNGDYTYSSSTTTTGETTTYTVSDKKTNAEVATSTTALSEPDLAKTYLELLGGSIVYAYGGGNNATVTEKTVIHLDNPSAVVNHILVNDAGVEADADTYEAYEANETNGTNETNETNETNGTYHDLLNDDRLQNKMGINMGYSFPSSAQYQIGSFYGGNNTAEMAIRPQWNLKKGKIRNLYSGGNRGRMTSPEGLLLELAPANDADLVVENVYGGCRMADVFPSSNGTDYVPTTNLSGYHFPDEFSARLLIRGGTVTNVYGGNDIRGKVYGGNAVGIYTSILGDVYGGGNGSYPYTDNPALENDQTYGDFYYDPDEILNQTHTEGATFTQQQSVEALNAIRPNAEQVSIRVYGGETASKPTVIKGAIYLGGNSATLAPSSDGTPTVELKIGTHVIADKVFLGNNGANMVATNVEDRANYKYEGVLRTMQRTDLTTSGKFSTIDLTNANIFAEYMKGAAMEIMPSVVFDNTDKGDPATYKEYTSYFGSFYCGGNVGSLVKDGCEDITFDHDVVIFDKLVGGCNNAVVEAQTNYNARYEGGVLGNPDATTGNKLSLNLSGLRLEPMTWKDTPDNSTFPFSHLEWHTVGADGTKDLLPADAVTGTASTYDLARRFEGGNIFGGCYTSGIVNGNVVININGTIAHREVLFDEVEEDAVGEAVYYNNDSYNITERRTGVILGQQGMDVLGKALTVFGGGKGQDTEIWGSTTVNLNKGYTFQIFGGSAEGVIGKPLEAAGTAVTEENTELGTTKNYDYIFNGEHYAYNPAYTCTVNLRGERAGVSKKSDSSEDMAEAEFIYGGGFEGPVIGNTVVNLGNGRIFNSFAGSCNADILGHTETYIGRQVKIDGTFDEGFPWIRDNVYGGNDLGGEIKGEANFASRVRSTANGDDYNAIGMVHNTALLTASAYMEYTQGRADAIFGGCYGTYDYTDSHYSDYFHTTGDEGTTAENLGTPKPGYTKPRQGNAFVNFRPTLTSALKGNEFNSVNRIYGAGQGYTGDADRDIMQRSSYILIDIPQEMDDENSTYPHYKYMEVFGGGAWNGLGMQQEDGVITPELFANMNNDAKDRYSARIDLVHGHIGAAYGGSFNEGVVRRSWVNVPAGSTIEAGSLFAGGYGSDIYMPCDVYEGHVEYHSADALLVNDRTREDKNKNTIGHDMMLGAIYGGNNAARSTLYGIINIDVPVRQNHYEYGMTTATVYGAGYGANTWNEYTEVNLDNGAAVYEVYGGGEAGGVMSAESITQYYANNPDKIEATKWKAAWTVGGGYDPGTVVAFHENQWTSLNNPLVRTAEMDDRSDKTYKYNTNVIIKQGATVNNYAYGGGYGKESDVFRGSGDVYGTTYIALLGGKVKKDIYAAGTMGAVYNLFGSPNFTASANAYIAGGTCRNVYGGGWKGDVGYTPMSYTSEGWSGTYEANTEYLGETHVVIGIRSDQTNANKLADIQKVKGTGGTLSDYGFTCGVPAIQRNAYAGGEGGAVFGSAHLTLNNGYIGYVHLNAGEEQDEQGNTVTAETATEERYEEKINDETYYVKVGEESVWQGTGRLADCGNVFGGGYDVRSSVDHTYVTMWGGDVRNSLHGGAEIATVGRGETQESGTANSVRELKAIHKAGSTHVEMYNGHVRRNVFGGGKGYNIWGYGQQGTLYTDGYVFGQTEVYIHGGEIGTDEGLASGYGNVFGGGDIGYVYSKGYFDARTLREKTDNPTGSTGSPNHWYYYDGDNLVEDCKVVVEPYLQIKGSGSDVTYDGTTYSAYDYVPTDYLNTLPAKDDDGSWGGDWTNLVVEDANGTERGITIHNAVFGGGNVSSNSDKSYANATTVHGNTTATLYDVYHRDFITIGTEHTGGLYGGGNLSLVNGYRELNITNYGTDYYGLEEQITLDEYRSLSNRERAYFQLQYICKADITIGGELYPKDKKISEEEYLKLVEDYGTTASDAFTPYGFCSIYAGRLLNTIQRADFCGVYGSRMVLQGAKDRVADVGEDIQYTINRVGEVSLNQQRFRAAEVPEDSEAPEDPEDSEAPEAPEASSTIHGNYFGIYSLVNYLGNLTSDVKFGDTRRYKNGNSEEDDPDKLTYYSYKKSRYGSGTPKSDRNKGVSYNQVALASGVFLEITTENSTADHKEYGYITGVVELDLINVKKDMVGGGFVYAKNEHRVPMYFPNKKNVLLSEYNMTKSDEARTYKRYYYTNSGLPTGTEAEDAYVISGDDDNVYQEEKWQTSGNFIHSRKTIVDDCYPTNNAYRLSDPNHSEAHYWYIKGEVYIYDQKVSAYTGAANAYAKAVHLPLTITAASHGQLQLLNVKPNLYAYYTANSSGEKVKIGTVENGKMLDKVWVNNDNDSYGLNEVVTWWDWHQMSYKDRQYFVTETFVNTVDCTIDGTDYAAGEYVMADTTTIKSGSHVVTYTDSSGDLTTLDMAKGISPVFRSSNNIGHDTGYLLTVDMDTPKVWDKYYTKGEPENTDSENNKLTKKRYDALTTSGQSAYIEGPTFTPTTTNTYGAREINVGDILTQAAVTHNGTSGEGAATVERAYVAKESVTYTYNGVTKTTNAGTAIPLSEYTAIGATARASFEEAYVCTSTVKLSEGEYIIYGELVTKTVHDALSTEDQTALTEAHICSEAGTFGGQSLTAGNNYSALTTWCALPASERTAEGFRFNYDAFDLLTNNAFLNVTTNVSEVPVDLANVTTTPNTSVYHSPYADKVGVEYQAVFHEKGSVTSVSYKDANGVTRSTTDGQSLTNEEYETVRNDKVHYTRVSVAAGGEDIYIATDNFVYDGIPYAKGQIVDKTLFDNTTGKVEEVHFDNSGSSGSSAITTYYCYEDYTDSDNATVAKGTLINDVAYSNLTNDQQYFTIQGREPTETTTLYVSSESDIKDVTSERIYTVVYQYTYYEEDDDGDIKLSSELHVVNIHIDLESGAPTIGQVNPPGTVLPGDAVGLKAPEVKPGLYEVLSNGWELFTSADDALRHRNGIAFTNNETPVYWYQNQKNYIRFYSKTYLGKTYSNNYVPLSVANYHDLKEVMYDDTHLHIDYDPAKLDRDCKVYINDYTTNDPATTQNGLDLLSRLVDLTYSDVDLTYSDATATTTYGALYTPGNIAGADNLDIILRTDLDHSGSSWTPIANESVQCFSGTLHGDGHTVSGLDHSLFGNLCGDVYNLGVTGSFTGAGVADEGSGYVENCWIKSSAVSGSAADKPYAVFGNPSREDSDTRGPIQVVNCYYPESNAYTVPASTTHGTATAMPDQAFYNGTVAYNLNGFYLKKRYYDQDYKTNGANGTNETYEYKYLPAAADGTLPSTMSTAYYPASYAVYSPVGTAETPALGYVESRYYDGDFIYAGGAIPESNNIRMRTVTTTDAETGTATTKTYYTPIWPDDYLFFGQTLTYGHVEARPHQEMPSAINRASERLVATDASNRVYRAPAYFRSGTMDVAHFNPAAVFAQTKKGDATVTAYKDMTAIDFTGCGDLDWAYGANGTNETNKAFFPPLLDDDGLTSFQNVDLTRNLLVYTGAPGTTSAAGKTGTVVSGYLTDQAYSETNANYRTVAVWDRYSDNVRGHWVQKTATGAYTATRDHMLVDRQDFNAPIAYQFDNSHRMWYQRLPEHYVDIEWIDDDDDSSTPLVRTTTGWEGISIPFKAEIVTTQQKGELTHFYNTTALGGSAAEAGTVGHEYWLRQFTAITVPDGSAVGTATMTYPDASTADGQKDYANTFLWDYYYSHNSYDDLNGDDYQEDDTRRTYYKQGREYPAYPRLAAATPYIIGFPGARYYEFDLSGTFTATTAKATVPAKLDAQTITFASATGAGINVSDDEMTGDTQTYSGNDYTFKPSYLNSPAVTSGKHAFLLNADGDSYVENTTATTADVAAFRPYFEATPASPSRPVTRSIVFANETNESYMPHEAHNSNEPGTLDIRAGRRKIVVTSTLRTVVDVRIVAASGITYSMFTLKPGETVETRIDNSGVYIVQTTDGQFLKKVSVKGR